MRNETRCRNEPSKATQALESLIDENKSLRHEVISLLLDIAALCEVGETAVPVDAQSRLSRHH